MTTMLAFWILCSLLLCLALVTGFKLSRALRAASQPLTPGSGVDRPANFYTPMERLLAGTDFTFLKSRPEISAAAIDRLRRERRKVFRKYLDCLAIDFAVITAEIRTIMVHSEIPRPELAGILLRSRLVFALAMTALEARLALHACGIHGVTISTAKLTESLAQMQRELRLLNPALAA